MAKGLSVITGGTGYVGYALVKNLESKGEKFRLFLRKENPLFDGIECEKAFGTLSSVEDLTKAFEGAETVYHIAGLVDITNEKDKELWEVNVEGTKNVIKACQNAKIKNLIYVSSVDAIPAYEGGYIEAMKKKIKNDNSVITERSYFNPGLVEGGYAKSKAIATQIVLESKDLGFKVCVVHPSACIGPYDFRGTSPIVTMIKLYMKLKMPVSMAFGMYNFVDVRDVAEGMYLAAEKGRNGECYILCGECMSVPDFIETISRANGVNSKLFKTPKALVMPFLPIVGKVFDMAKLPPVLNDYSIRKLEENCNFSYQKAATELGYQPMPARRSLIDTIDWIREQEK